MFSHTISSNRSRFQSSVTIPTLLKSFGVLISMAWFGSLVSQSKNVAVPFGDMFLHTRLFLYHVSHCRSMRRQIFVDEYSDIFFLKLSSFTERCVHLSSTESHNDKAFMVSRLPESMSHWDIIGSHNDSHSGSKLIHFLF